MHPHRHAHQQDRLRASVACRCVTCRASAMAGGRVTRTTRALPVCCGVAAAVAIGAASAPQAPTRIGCVPEPFTMSAAIHRLNHCAK